MKNKKQWDDFESNWMSFQKYQKKNELELDQVDILSVTEMKGDMAFCRVIDPKKIRYFDFSDLCLAKALSECKITNLTSVQKEMLDKTRLILRYDGKNYLADPLLFKSFTDLFGITKMAAGQSIWRDLHLAYLFSEQHMVTVSYGWIENHRTVMAFHSRNLQSSGISIYSIAKKIVEEMQAEVFGSSFSKTKIQAEILLNDFADDGWQKTVILRDDSIGRESFTVIVGFRSGHSLVYCEELRKNHREKVPVDKVYSDIEALIRNTRFQIPEEHRISIQSIINLLSPVLGKKRTGIMKAYLSRRLDDSGEPDAGKLLKIAAAATAEDYGALESNEIAFRFRLGRLCKC